MPSPFSKKPQQNQGDTNAETIPVLNSALTCEKCFVDSYEGTYYPGRKLLVWDCDYCGFTNIVKGIEL